MRSCPTCFRSIMPSLVRATRRLGLPSSTTTDDSSLSRLGEACLGPARRGLREPVPARARRGAEDELGVALEVVQAGLGLVGLARAVEARRVDREDRVVDL